MGFGLGLCLAASAGTLPAAPTAARVTRASVARRFIRFLLFRPTWVLKGSPSGWPLLPSTTGDDGGVVEDTQDGLRQRAGGLGAELDADARGRPVSGPAQVDVQRVVGSRVHRMVEVDAGVGDPDPAGRPFRAAGDGHGLGDIGAHAVQPFRCAPTNFQMRSQPSRAASTRYAVRSGEKKACPAPS